IGLVLSGCGTVENGKTALSEKSEATSTPKTVTTTGKAADVEWEAEIKEIAGAALSPTEKADKTESLARTYSKSVADDELKVFESFIVEEYKNGNYLKGH
ncbi:hypothetical protein, partial [Paenibacillus sp. P22]|uniref:hypothetical protein n=1 Tax=Paenibacillus sp. P22 TaxID=483908 RepID=UPI0035B54FFC